jgi:ABC-2 type transport system permease protein
MNANVATAAPAAAPALLRRAGPLDTIVALVRRELWEHRALWIAPLVVEGLLALALLFGRFDLDLPDGVLTVQQRVAILTIGQWAAAQIVFLVTSIVLGFYLLDCLYAERKDRSILFWKSLPLSDGLTVSSKFLVAAVGAPLGVFLLATVSDLVFLAIAAMRAPGTLSWSTYEWARTELALLLEVILATLWYAPVGAALLLLSAAIRRAPLLWATLVPVVMPILERVALGTHYIWDFERYRMNGIVHKLLGGPNLFADEHHLPTVGAVLGRLSLGAAFSDVDLWLGVAAALAMVYAAARIRRYRDDT